MTQEDLILKHYDIVIKSEKADSTCFKMIRDITGFPLPEIKRIVGEKRLFLDVRCEKPIYATENELMNFPAYTWENLSETEKKWYNENNTIQNQELHIDA